MVQACSLLRTKLGIGVRLYHSSRGKGPLNVLFLGRNAFSCQTFEQLYNAPDVWRTIAVATTPDEWIGRKRDQLSVSPLKALAKSLDVSILEVPKADAAASQWLPPEEMGFQGGTSVLVTASYGRAVSKILLDQFETRINVHPSLLPNYRGAAPIQRTIIDGMEETGVSIIDMNDINEGGFDSGNLRAWTDPIRIPKSVYYSQLESILAREGGKLLSSMLRDLMCGKSASIPQDHTKATRAYTIKPHMYEVHWFRSDATQIDRLHRAISFKKPLFTHMLSSENRKLQLVQMHLSSHPLLPPGTPPGFAQYFKQQDVVVISCKDNTEVHATHVQPHGKKILGARDWWNGIQKSMLLEGFLPLGSGA